MGANVMNLIALTDTKLAALHRQVANELERRARIASNGHDPAAIIYGNEMAKRALVVAAAGQHPLLFVGPPNCGKSMLRAVALELGLTQTFEAWPCACGHRTSVDVECRCSARQIDRHIRRFPVADIAVEMCYPPERVMKMPGTTLADMRKQIDAKSDFDSLDLAEVAGNLMRAAVREVGLDPDARRRVLAVARTIANLDQSQQIEPSHLCEAINYRMLGR
jgi:predicted ATPase with chaperone activity